MTTIRDTNLAADLDLSGKNLTLPEQVDYIVEYPNQASFPLTGRVQRLYIDLETGTASRWNGTAYLPAADLPPHFSDTPPANPYPGRRWTTPFDLVTYEWFAGAWVEKPTTN